MNHPILRTTLLLLLSLASGVATAKPTFSWRYYRVGNTGIQGDINQALWVGPDGDPYIGGYDAGFEEGGFAKFIQSQNRWENFSNVDYPVIGHPDEQGVVRFNDIVADQQGTIWAGSWRGALAFDPTAKKSRAFRRYSPANSSLVDTRVSDIDISPDGRVWFANGGTSSFDPVTQQWTRSEFGDEFIAAQPKPGGGYLVWSATRPPTLAPTYVFDSTSGAWTTLTPSGAANEIVGLPGKDSVDDAGNLWVLRSNQPGEHASLHYRRPNGTYATPIAPYDGVTFGITAFKAYGTGLALLVDAGGTTWQFNGVTWANMGAWQITNYTYAVDIDSQGNIWVAGVGGAAKRDAVSGKWQRYRITNSGNIDNFVQDITIDSPKNHIYITSNAGPGTGGISRFDGQRWKTWNQLTYGLGENWPFPTDNCDAISYRSSNGRLVLSPSWMDGIHEWTGSEFSEIPGLAGAVKVAEDSTGRLWGLGEYYNLQVKNTTGWSPVDIIGWGDLLFRDPVRPGTVWAGTDYEIVRTDGSYRFSRQVTDFPEASGVFMGLAADRVGAWTGVGTISTGVGYLVYVKHGSGRYKVWSPGPNWPFAGQYVRVLGVSPDGRVWMNYTSDYPSEGNGLCAFDGKNVINFPAPFGGVPQWGGLPHASIQDFEIRTVSGGGYEIWMSCLSRGIAVLKVQNAEIP